MRAYLKVEKNESKILFEEIKEQIHTLYIEKLFPVDELVIYNPKLEIHEGDTTISGELIIETMTNKIYKPIIKTESNVSSFDVFIRVFDIGKLIDDLGTNNNFKNDNTNQDNKLYMYRNMIISIVEESKNFSKLLSEVITFIEEFGFIRTPNFIENVDSDECNIVYFLVVSYIIYETFHMRQNHANGDTNYSKVFSILHIDIKNADVLNLITDNLEFLDTNFENHCSFETIYDEDNECWKTRLLFNNALTLAIYELKIQLSRDNNEDTLGICKNVACGRCFKRIGLKQQYCLEDDCNLIRQRQRKEKSRQKKDVKKI